MEKGIAENVLEMALRGKPREPFYMVGRMEGQSVVLRAEKGKLRLLVDDDGEGKTQELVYEVTRREESEGSREREEGDGKGREAGGREAAAKGFGAYGRGEVPGGVDAVDRAAEAGRDLPGDGGDVGDLAAVAGPGDGGDAVGLAAPGPGREGDGLEPPSCHIIGEKEPDRVDEGVGPAIEEAAEKYRGIPGRVGGFTPETVIRKEHSDGEREEAGAGAGGHHPAGT